MCLVMLNSCQSCSLLLTLEYAFGFYDPGTSFGCVLLGFEMWGTTAMKLSLVPLVVSKALCVRWTSSRTLQHNVGAEPNIITIIRNTQNSIGNY